MKTAAALTGSLNSFLQGFLQDIESLVTRVNPFALLLCFVALLTVFLFFERKDLRLRYILFAVTAAVYSTFVLTITLLGRAGGEKSSWDQLFSIYVRAFSGDKAAMYDIFYNIVLFIPIGILSSRFRQTRFVVIGLLLIPLCIEIAQLITSRGVFEISDIINNFLGGLIGLFIVRLIERLIRYPKEKNKKAAKE